MIVDRPTAASIFGVTTDTVRSWARAGMPTIPPSNPKGKPEERRVMVNTVEAHRWLLQRALASYW
jgi:hypothetical protein